MFRWLFQYWYTTVDTPSILFKSNLWFFINLRIFKVKLSNTIVYFITSLNNLTSKNIKVFYKVYSFEHIYWVVSSWFLLFLCFTWLFI